MRTKKKILLQFNVREGDRLHTHRVLYTTFCENLEFSVYWYIYHYWDRGSFHDGKHIFSFGGEIAYSIIDYTVLTDEQYETLKELFK